MAFVSKGKIEPSDITKMLITQSSLTPQKIIQFSEMLLKYPEQKQKYDELITEMTDKLKNLDKVFRRSELKSNETEKNKI
jgi:hypothetical protein